MRHNGRDVAGARKVWEAALASEWEQPPVWVHGDVTGSNLLVRDGRLDAVIDFGCSAVGDPACDTVIAWTFLEGESRAAFTSNLALDEDTWARGRGWALWKALTDLATDQPSVRFGWRFTPRQIVDEVIADYSR